MQREEWAKEGPEREYTGAYYLHVNGDLIHKRWLPGLIDDLTESDLVRAYWLIDGHDGRTAWRILIEAAALGADKTRINALASKWDCNNADARTYAQLKGIDLVEHAGQYVAVFDALTGRGNTALEALISLHKQKQVIRYDWL